MRGGGQCSAQQNCSLWVIGDSSLTLLDVRSSPETGHGSAIASTRDLGNSDVSNWDKLLIAFLRTVPDAHRSLFQRKPSGGNAARPSAHKCATVGRDRRNGADP
ncbi:hypothetical protein [Candidatus Filomicrobium marinum]|uniref:hypothetical protein n=1 Tax=Candidatus Filomicrobium marinum TaxID=1608628 RepID=UPI001AEC238E|nr:hypothetical protein [Candidatus Filomicrobium marinum]